MDFDFGGFDSGLDSFEAEMEDFQLVKVKKMDRHLRTGEGGSILSTPRLHDGTVYLTSADYHVYAVDAGTGEELWRFTTSNPQPIELPPAHDAFKLEVKKEETIDETVEEENYKSKKEDSVSLSNYAIESEYASTSDYKTKSDYDVSMVIFENPEVILGTSNDGNFISKKYIKLSTF